MCWVRFQMQYRAIGREKADGYDPAMFGDMTPEELGTARAMLLKRALAGDTIDLYGLRYVGSGAIVTALRAARGQGALRPAVRDIKACETLFVLTGDPADLGPVLQHLDSRDGAARARRTGSPGSTCRRSFAPRWNGGSPASATAASRCRSCRLGWRPWEVPAGDPVGFNKQLPLIRRILARPWWRRTALLAATAHELAGRDRHDGTRDGGRSHQTGDEGG